MEGPFDPVGRCIYCDAKRYSETRDQFGTEHIIPEGLGGRILLPAASCFLCEQKTNEFENFCQTEMLRAFRYKLGIKGKRRKTKRVTSLPIEFLINGEWTAQNVPLAHYPLTLLIPTFPLPDILRLEPVEKSTVLQFSVINMWDEQANAALTRRFGAKDIRFVSGNTQIRQFVRMLAKIAYSYAVAKRGFGGFRQLVLPIIEGDLSFAHLLIGCTAKIPDAKTRHSLDLQSEIHNGRNYWVVRIRMFADLGWPEYICVVGFHLDESDTAQLPEFSSVRPWRIPRSEMALHDKGLMPQRPAPQTFIHPTKTDADAAPLNFQIGFGQFNGPPVQPPPKA